jgi:Ca2+-transporting ATPase
MIVVLVVAGVLAFFFKGEGSGVPADSIAIFAIVVLFVALGVFQEHRAQRAIAALKQMAAPTVRVRRGGALVELSSRELVPGDVILLETGAVVPADCRILESVNLRVQEAALTGESEAIEKTAAALPAPELPLGDRRNMGYLGTFVSAGRGPAVVVATGMQTELGKIARLLQGVQHEPTPLTRKLDALGKTLALIAVGISILVGLTGFAEGKDVGDVLILGISIAVAIVPEGLPAVLTFTLALGAQRMLRKNALIRRLPAVEPWARSPSSARTRRAR